MESRSVANRKVCTLLALLLPLTASGAGKIPEEGVVRTTEQVLAQSDLVYKLTVGEIRAGGCGGDVDLHVARVIESFRGAARKGATLKFCGYAQLVTTGDYVVGMNQAGRGAMPRLMPDAVYSEVMPGQYFRLVSYESPFHDVAGRKAMVSGFEEPGLADVLSALKAKPAAEGAR